MSIIHYTNVNVPTKGAMYQASVEIDHAPQATEFQIFTKRKATQPLFNSLVYVLCRYLPILHCVVHSVVLMTG